ncbi:MAG: hypothetical protein ACFFDY_00525 [Candidatus Thorarchaeota archaeon]
MAVTKTLIWNNNISFHGHRKHFGVTSGGRLWSVAYVSNIIKAKYSDDDGSNWSSEETVHLANIGFPAIFIDGNDALHVVGSNGNYVSSPRWRRRNGSWLDVETIKYDVMAYNNYGDIVVTQGHQPFCFWADVDVPGDRICKLERSGDSWQAEVTTSFTSGFTCWGVCACIDDFDLMHIIWLEVEKVDTNHRKVMHATFNGSSFSSITTLDEVTNGSLQEPIIRYVESGKCWAMWARDGVGDETSYDQVRYRIYVNGIGWSGGVQNLTNNARNHQGYDVIYCNGFVTAVYGEYGSYASAPTKYNLVYKAYNTSISEWGDATQVTEESDDIVAPNCTIIGNNLHLSFWLDNGANYDIYHGTFVPIGPVQEKEIYDYLSTVSADVDVTLSLDPQVVIQEVGGKGDIVHLADDESEERVGYSSDFKFYIIIRYDLLDESDAGTLLDIWADSSKANGRVNSFKFAHPDNHTYVVRFDTDMTRLMSPTYYTIKNIRLKVLGRIADS